MKKRTLTVFTNNSNLLKYKNLVLLNKNVAETNFNFRKL